MIHTHAHAHAHRTRTSHTHTHIAHAHTHTHTHTHTHSICYKNLNNCFLSDKYKFSDVRYEVNEGGEVQLSLNVTKPLPDDVEIKLKYKKSPRLSLGESCAVTTMLSLYMEEITINV